MSPKFPASQRKLESAVPFCDTEVRAIYRWALQMKRNLYRNERADRIVVVPAAKSL